MSNGQPLRLYCTPIQHLAQGMKAIRYRYNAGSVVLLASGEAIGRAISGNKLRVRLRDGEYRILPFGGFVSAATAAMLRRVKVRDIDAWTEDAAGIGGWQLTGTAFEGHVVGAYIGGMVMIVEGSDGGPIIIA